MCIIPRREGLSTCTCDAVNCEFLFVASRSHEKCNNHGYRRFSRKIDRAREENRETNGSRSNVFTGIGLFSQRASRFSFLVLNPTADYLREICFPIDTSAAPPTPLCVLVLSKFRKIQATRRARRQTPRVSRAEIREDRRARARARALCIDNAFLL